MPSAFHSMTAEQLRKRAEMERAAAARTLAFAAKCERRADRLDAMAAEVRRLRTSTGQDA